MAQENKFHVRQGLDGKRVVLFDRTTGFPSVVLRENWNDRQIKEAISKGVPIEGHFGAKDDKALEELYNYRQGIVARRNLITGKKYVKTELVAMDGGPMVRAAKGQSASVGLSKDTMIKLYEIFKSKAPVLLKAQSEEELSKVKDWQKAAEVLGVEPNIDAVLAAINK